MVSVRFTTLSKGICRDTTLVITHWREKKKECAEQCSNASIEDCILSRDAEAVQDLQLLASVICKSNALVRDEVPGCLPASENMPGMLSAIIPASQADKYYSTHLLKSTSLLS